MSNIARYFTVLLIIAFGNLAKGYDYQLKEDAFLKTPIMEKLKALEWYKVNKDYCAKYYGISFLPPIGRGPSILIGKISEIFYDPDDETQIQHIGFAIHLQLLFYKKAEGPVFYVGCHNDPVGIKSLNPKIGDLWAVAVTSNSKGHYFFYSAINLATIYDEKELHEIVDYLEKVHSQDEQKDHEDRKN